MILDSHLHCFHEGFFPRPWFEAKAREWSGRTWPPRDPAAIVDRIEPRMLDADGSRLVGDLRAAGVDAGVCIGIDPGLAFGAPDAIEITERIRLQAAPHRQQAELRGFVSIDPRRPRAREHLRAAVAEYGFRGVKVYAPHGYSPADPVCWPLYEESLELGIVVMFHTAFVPYPLQSHYANPLLVQSVQYLYPELTIILAHAGHPLWMKEAALVSRSHPRTHLEVSGLQRALDDSPDDVRDALRFFRDEVGAHRLLFGSDHYALDDAKAVALARWVDFAATTPVLGADERELFMGGNALRLLGG